MKGIKYELDFIHVGDRDDELREFRNKMEIIRESFVFDTVTGFLDNEGIVNIELKNKDKIWFKIFGELDESTRVKFKSKVSSYNLNFHPTDKMGSYNMTAFGKQIEAIFSTDVLITQSNEEAAIEVPTSFYAKQLEDLIEKAETEIKLLLENDKLYYIKESLKYNIPDGSYMNAIKVGELGICFVTLNGYEYGTDCLPLEKYLEIIDYIILQNK